MCNYSQQMSCSCHRCRPILVALRCVKKGERGGTKDNRGCGRDRAEQSRLYCVLSDRKYQVIFCNFSTLPIDLWLAAVMASPSPPPYPGAHSAFVCKTKGKPSERCPATITTKTSPGAKAATKRSKDLYACRACGCQVVASRQSVAIRPSPIAFCTEKRRHFYIVLY